MSRVIKFRAWSVEGGQMYDLDPKYTHFNNGDLLDNDDWKVMQFTGLHDRNGVEIYEGDIFRDEDGIWVVDFEVGTFVLRSVPDTQYTCRLGVHAGAGEVIGNVLANPELLEGEKV